MLVDLRRAPRAGPTRSRSSEVRRFEAELLEYFRANHADLLEHDPHHGRPARRRRARRRAADLPRRLRDEQLAIEHERERSERWPEDKSASCVGASSRCSPRGRSPRRWSSSPPRRSSRAQARIVANRPYREGMERIVVEAAAAADPAAAAKLLGTPETSHRQSASWPSPATGASPGSYNSGVAAGDRAARGRALRGRGPR